MSSRGRALGFALGALVCAVLAAAAASSYTGAAGEEFGELRDVVVISAPLERGVEITGREADQAFEVRRVPVAFAPPDALAAPGQAIGRRLAIPLPPGSYLTAADLAAAGPRRPRRDGSPPGTTPVEIEVAAAGALAAAGMSSGGSVDVVVAASAAPGAGAARTYVAAERVPLLALVRARPEPGVAERWSATLALTRGQALELIRAESLGRTMRLLAR